MIDFASPGGLSRIRVAVLATDGFEESELLEPLEALLEAGADAKVISLPETSDSIRGKSRSDGEAIDVDATVDEVTSDDFAALLVPGGKANAARLRESPEAVSFVRGFLADGKPVAAICHGPWLVAAAGEAAGRTLTSYPAIRDDLESAGADWVDEEVVVDRGLTTSRRPSDLDAFIEATLEQIAATAHSGRPA